MKCISIRQPWAWHIVNGIKDIENRKWRSNYRGRLLIHASKAWDQEWGYDFRQSHLENPGKLLLPFGTIYSQKGNIIGVVSMVDCVDHHPSKWFKGPWGFVFESPEFWEDPVPYRGKLGIFNVPESVFKQQV